MVVAFEGRYGRGDRDVNGFHRAGFELRLFLDLWSMHGAGTDRGFPFWANHTGGP